MSSSTDMIRDDETPDDTGHLTSLTGNGLDLLDGRQLQASPPPSVFQGSSHLTVHKDVADYVSTPALEEACDILQDRGWVVLCGPPGSGKTTLAHALCRMSCEHDQYAVYVLEKVHLWKSHVGERDQSVVVLDGNFGRCYLNEGQYWDWHMIFNTILEMLKKGGIRLVITVYPHILHELQQLDSHLDSFLTDDSGIVWLTDSLPRQVKENMLSFHLKKLHLESDTQHQIVETVLLNDESGPVFPWCCGQMIKQWSTLEDPTSIFLLPAEAHAKLFKDMVLDKAYGAIFVAVLVLTLKGVSNFLYHLGEGRCILEKLDMAKVDSDTLTRFADILHGQKSILFQGTFSSRVLYEAAGLALGRFFRLPTLLRVCDVPFLVKYVHFTVKEQAAPCVHVGGVPGCSMDPTSCTADQQALVDKICTEIIEGNLQTICQHPSLQHPEFLKELGEYCAKDKKMMKQLLNAKDTVYQLPLVYWSAFLPSPILTQWCLDKMETVKQLPVVSLMACSLSDHVTQISLCRLQSFLSERLTADLFEHQSCVMDFPFPDQCFTKEVEQQVKTLRTAELVQGRHKLLFMPLPPDLVTVQVSQDRLTLQVKDRRLWYLVFRLLTNRGVGETDKDGDSLLHVAVNSGETGIVGMCLEVGAVISQRNKKGMTPYQLTQPVRALAAKKRKQTDTDNIFKRFLQAQQTEAQSILLYDIDVNQKDNWGRTLLFMVCFDSQRDAVDLVSLLVQIGSNVNARAGKLQASYLPMKRIFNPSGQIRHGAGYTPLLLAACNGHSGTVRLLLQHGADVSAQDWFGETPLHLAASNGHTDTVELLLQHGADANAHNKFGNTPVLLAAEDGHSASVELLLQHGASVNVHDEDGDTPLLLAASNAHTGIVELLLQHGASVNEQDKLDDKLLLRAVKDGHHKTTQLLLHRGTEVNVHDDDGDTSLHLAARNAHTGTVELLLQHGAGVNARNKFGNTPLLQALKALDGHHKMTQLLLQHGASVNVHGENDNTPLHLAVGNGHTDTVELILQHGADVKARDKFGNTPLLRALKDFDGQHKTTQLLLQHGASVNVHNENDNTPLHLAVGGGHTDTVELLLQHGADINAQDKFGYTPLLLAASNGHSDTVELLLQHGADAHNEFGDTPLMSAAENGRSDTVELLLQHGAPVNAQNMSGDTPLISAARNGHCETTQQLLQHGAHTNVQSEDGDTPLLLAAMNGHSDTVALLLQHGADVNAGNNFGDTPILLAASNGHSDTVDLLSQHGANINGQDKFGNTPLLGAARAPDGHPETALLLLQHGAHVNAHDEDGDTPLMWAASNGRSDTVELLLQHGADVSAQDKLGSTPLLLSAGNGQHDTTELLLRHGADVNAQDKHGYTPLMLAARDGHSDTVKILLHHGADVNVQDESGNTARTLAVRSGHVDTLEALGQHDA